jgi:hypothetical protein
MNFPVETCFQEVGQNLVWLHDPTPVMLPEQGRDLAQC